MAGETEISTPVETADVTTSETEVSTSETTSEPEVTSNDTTAETETNEQITQHGGEEQQEKLYAGKYKSIEELEKGYNEAQKTLTQNLQLKAKYDELVKKQEQQDALRLERAREQGYNSADDMQIANYIKQAELNEFIDTLPYYVQEEEQIKVQQYLNAYQKTGDTRYLNEAKRYYPAEFLEKVAVGKRDVESRMRAKLEQEAKERINKANVELAEIIKTEYADFISDLSENKGKAQALEMFCEGNFIKSKEDMDVFVNIYNQIADVAKANAIKEYEAQKAIEKTKQAAQIEGNPDGLTLGDSMPSYAQLVAMSQEDFEKACDKYGVDKIMAAN